VRKAIWIIGVLAVALAIGGYVFFSGERKALVRYKTAPVERGTIVSVVSATGTVNPVTMVQVGSQVSGSIESLHADFNSPVKTGDVVARIDPFPYRAMRDQALANLANTKAAVSKAKTELAQRKRELNRVQSLIKQEFVSQNDVDVAITNYDGAGAQLEVVEAAVKQAKAALEAAELDLKYTVIRSPVSGTVISRLVEVGQRVAANFQIPTLFIVAEDLTNMQVEANVSESDIAGVTDGKAASFTVDAYPGQPFKGRVKQVRNAPIAVQNVVTYQVVIGVDNRDLRLKPGMTANVAIEVAKREDVLKLPNAALRFTPVKMERVERPEKPVDAAAPRRAVASDPLGMPKRVWRLGSLGDPEPIPIESGISDGVVTELLKGGDLKEGDQIIVGIETSKGPRESTALPSAFGTGQRRGSSRDRGL
jgi:HlyD family secretion protein